jgi:Skp family chaperone for outer membrane proteins
MAPRRAIALFLAGVLLLLAAGTAGPAAAQQGSTAQPVRSPILTIESDRFFAQSMFGRRIASEIEADSAVLAAENREIEAELIAEEQALTEERAIVDRETFGEMADEFDTRVQRIRREQDAKARDVTGRADEARRDFLNAARPVLAAIMRERGAAIIVERRSVFISAGAIDITDEAIASIDAAIGDGSALAETPVTPDAPDLQIAPDDGPDPADAPAGAQE